MSISTKIDPDTGALHIERGFDSDELETQSVSDATEEKSAARDFFTGADLGASGASMEKLKNPFMSVWAMSAMLHVTDPLTAVGLKFTEDKRGGDVQLDIPELNAFWERPGTNCGQRLSRVEFITITSLWVQLEGHAFWILDDTWLGRGEKSPIIIAKPSDVRPILDRMGGELLGWQYMCDGKAEFLHVDQVVQIKKANPFDPFNGLSRWKAARLAAESDHAAGVFSKNLMENNGDRGPLVIADGTLTDPQIEQITSVLRQKQAMSRRGDFKPAFLAGPNIKVEKPDVQSVDSAFIGQRLENRHEVYIAFGVPASFANISASYSIGSASDLYRLIEGTCMPHGSLIAEGVELVSQRFLGGERKRKRTLFAEFEWDDHSVMQQVRAERFDQATKAVDRGMPWKAANEYLNLGMMPFAGWEVGRVPFNMTTVQPAVGVAASEEPVASEEEEKLSAVEELEELFKCKAHGAGSEKLEVKSEKSDDADSMREPDPERLELWQKLTRLRAPHAKRFESRFTRLLHKARTETLENLASFKEKSQKSEAAVMKMSTLEVVFDLGAWLEEFLEGMSQVSRNVLIQAGMDMWEYELGNDNPLEMPAAEVLTALQKRENYLSGTGTEIWNEVRKSVADGIDAGDSIDDIEKRVRESFNGISKSRARKIAVTETAAAYETGRALTMKEAGVTHKEWLTSQDERVRISHAAMDGKIVPIDDDFELRSGVKLPYPAASGAPADEVIGCRCVHLAATEDDYAEQESEE